MNLTVYEQLQNPLTRRRNDAHRARVLKLFPATATVVTPHYLALRRYLVNAPERFFNRAVHQLFFSWLREHDATNRVALQQYMDDAAVEIGRALLFLSEANQEDWHDSLLDAVDEYELLRIIDRRIHRNYLRLVEGVLTPLTRIIAHFSRRDRAAGTEGLDIWAIVRELQAGPMASTTQSYRHTMRNGIGHGGITYQQYEITYRDKRGAEESIAIRDVIRLCDDLIDDCNALASALTLFLIIHRDDGYAVPEELLVQELQEETNSPWWSIEGVIRSQIQTGPQLLVYARTATRDFTKVQWSAVQSGILAELFASGYGRYFISIRAHAALPGWAAFNGARIRELREARTPTISGYTNIVESIFYSPRIPFPRTFSRIDTLLQSIRIQWPLLMEESRVARGIPAITCRTAKMHRNGWRSVLNGSVVLDTLEREIHPNDIRSHRRRLVRTALREATSESGARYFPLGFVQIAVFGTDYRKRRLQSFGLGADLICTVRYQTIKRIKSPDIFGSTVEKRGHWRIAWNKAWLETQPTELRTPPQWERVAPARKD